MVEPDEETDSLRVVGRGDRDGRRPSRSNVEMSEIVLFDRKWGGAGEW